MPCTDPLTHSGRSARIGDRVYLDCLNGGIEPGTLIDRVDDPAFVIFTVRLEDGQIWHTFNVWVDRDLASI